MPRGKPRIGARADDAPRRRRPNLRAWQSAERMAELRRAKAARRAQAVVQRDTVEPAHPRPSQDCPDVMTVGPTTSSPPQRDVVEPPGPSLKPPAGITRTAAVWQYFVWASGQVARVRLGSVEVYEACRLGDRARIWHDMEGHTHDEDTLDPMPGPRTREVPPRDAMILSDVSADIMPGALQDRGAPLRVPLDLSQLL